MTFAELGLDLEFCEKLSRRGIEKPTPIQTECFLKISESHSVLGLSKTGTGKTLAYLAPLLQAQKKDPNRRTLVLLPTRELVAQVQSSLEALMSEGMTCVPIVGGEPEDRQVEKAAHAHWILATPGRLLDLLQRRKVTLAQVKTLVFDEADRLLDMGFIDDIRALMKFLEPPLQMLFFSATLHFGVEEMAYEFGAEVERIGFEEDELTVAGLDHRVAFVGEEEKFHALAHFLHGQREKRGIIFSNYRDKAHYISDRLRGLGYHAEGLSAQLSQPQRSRIMELFRAEKLQTLVASDLAARGLDVQGLDYVVNIDLPEDAATYVHRVGRTARAGLKGVAISYVGYEDALRLEKIEKFIESPIAREKIPLEHLEGPLPRNPLEAPRAPRPAQPAQSHSAEPRAQGGDARRSSGDRHRAPRPAAPKRSPESARPHAHAPRVAAPTAAPKVAPSWSDKLVAFVKKLFGATPPAAPAVVAPTDRPRSDAPQNDSAAGGRGRSGSRGPRGSFSGGRRGPRSSTPPARRRPR